jgi:hypothetical protein
MLSQIDLRKIKEITREFFEKMTRSFYQNHYFPNIFIPNMFDWYQIYMPTVTV